MKQPPGDRSSPARLGPPTRRRFLRGLGAAAAGATAGVVGWKEATEHSGAGPPSRTAVQSGNRGGLDPPVTADVREYGAAGDGATDDTAAFEAALRDALHINVPPGSYTISRPLALPATGQLTGGGKYNTRLVHAHDGDFARLAHQCTLSNLAIEGQGERYLGRGLVVSGSDGQQSLSAVAVVGFEGYCIDFETEDAGSQFRATHVDLARVGAGTGTGRYAVHVAAGRQLRAVPRSFVQLETQGQCAIDFGGCNDMYVVASTLGDLRFSPESRGVNITASRLLNQEALTVDGHGVTFVGCDISAEITIAPHADHIVLTPNAFNRLPVIDRSGNDRHQLPPPYSG